MKILKYITIITIYLIGMFIFSTYIIKFNNSYLEQKDISLVDNNYSVKELYSYLSNNSKENDVTYLNYREIDGKINIYCIGSLCELEENRYYATYNDKNAVKTLPFILNDKMKIYNFKYLENVDIKNINFKILSNNENNIKNAITDLQEYDLQVEENETLSLHHKKKKFIFLIYYILFIMYLISIIYFSKKYIIDKYNGKTALKVVGEITKEHFFTFVVSTFICLISLIFFINNNVFIKNNMLYYILFLIINYLLLIIIEIIMAMIIRRSKHFKYMIKGVRKISKVLLLINVFIISLNINGIVKNLDYKLNTTIGNFGTLVPRKINENYYTYSIVAPGIVDLNYLNRILDPAHFRFYIETEDKYNGVVASFQNSAYPYPVINENYLKLTSNDVDLDGNKINLLTKEKINIGAYDDILNIVNVKKDSYKYIDQDTGLISIYTGPVFVINKNVVKELDDPVGISLTLQSNNYFLNIDEGDVGSVNNIINELGISENISSFYHPLDISNDYNIELNKELKLLTLQFISVVVILLVNIFLYFLYEFNLDSKNVALKIVNGEDFNEIIRKKIRLLIVINTVPLIFFHGFFNILLYLFLILVACLSELFIVVKIKNNILKYIKE